MARKNKSEVAVVANVTEVYGTYDDFSGSLDAPVIEDYRSADIKRMVDEESLSLLSDLMADAVITVETETADLADVVAEIEVDEVIEVIAEETETPAPDGWTEIDTSVPEETDEPRNLTFDEIVAAITKERADELTHIISREISAREDFEMEKKPDNTTMQRTLKKIRSQMVSHRAAKFIEATGTDLGFMNRSISSGVRYNVYAIQKYADLVAFSVKGDMMNAINNAVVRSMFKVLDAGLTWDMEAAKAACAKQYPVKDAAIRPLLTRHTVDVKTAPTQSSSTMQALVTMGVVKAEGSAKNPTYRFTDKPVVEKFRQLLAA